jgi:hypothetical protein
MAGESIMRNIILAATIALTTLALSAGAQAFDDTIYPNLKGQWTRFVVRGLGGQPSFDQTKPWAFGQEAPLTPEYKKVMEASLADQANGGQGNFPGYSCIAFGMPMMMAAFSPQEYIVTPDTTYILINNVDQSRRIYTDGREWPKDIEASYQGYSIGKWIDTDGDGRFDTLEVETRGPFKGPRVYDGSGLPLHYDNESVIKEKIYLDKNDPNTLHDEITVFDHALTRPWTVDKRFLRNRNPRPAWPEFVCGEYNAQIRIGKEYYFLDADGELMPTRRDQPPPDLKHFKATRKSQN